MTLRASPATGFTVNKNHIIGLQTADAADLVFYYDGYSCQALFCHTGLLPCDQIGAFLTLSLKVGFL